MSDFGLDAFALDDLGSPGTSNPLQVARDLIATGKPRSALDILAEHHARLADDPEYLMLCGQAWFAAGDAPRAQHALLGAARVAPEDPRPLQLLGDLLLERGETDRAKRLFRKAERLGQSEPPEPEAFDVPGERGDADLIAFAERKERRRRNPVALRQWLLMLVTVLAIGGLMSAIASWVTPADPSLEEAAAGDRGAENDASAGESIETAVASDEPSVREPTTPELTKTEPEALDGFETREVPAISPDEVIVAPTTPEASGEAESPGTDVPEPPAETTPPPSEPRESTVPAPAPKPTVPAPPPEPAAASIEGTVWPEENASPLLAPPAPIAETSVPTVAMPAAPSAKPEVTARPKKKARPAARKVTKPRRPAAAPPVVDEAAVEAELASVSSARAATERGDQLAAAGQLATAARFYRRAVELDPDYAPALVAVGRSYLRAEKYPDAMRSATRALQHARGVDARPGLEAEALYQMGRVRHEWGDQDAARRLLRQSTSMARAPAEAWFYLGESLARDNWPDARAAYEEYLARRPNGHLSDRARRAIQ